MTADQGAAPGGTICPTCKRDRYASAPAHLQVCPECNLIGYDPNASPTPDAPASGTEMDALRDCHRALDRLVAAKNEKERAGESDLYVVLKDGAWDEARAALAALAATRREQPAGDAGTRGGA